MEMHLDAAVFRSAPNSLQIITWNGQLRLGTGMPSCLAVVAQIKRVGVVFGSKEEISRFEVAMDNAFGVNVLHYIQLKQRN